jgi:DnaK suppressor protein
MNATVTKSVRKSTVAKNPGKTATKPVAVAKPKLTGKTAGESTLKRVARKLVKKITTALKPGAKPAKTVAKAAAKPVRATVKNTVKPQAKSALKAGRKPVSKSAPNSVASAMKAKKAAAADTGTVKMMEASARTDANRKPVVPAVRTTAIVVSEAKQSGVSMSSDKPAAGLANKIEQTVVSKVSEVATKTTKPTPTVATDGVLLSEAQLLKMSDKDYMNADQLAFFKARLQQLEKELLKNAGETTEHLRETVLVPDPADRATIEEEHALELRTRDRERKLLKKVQQSIASIDSGDYGWCEETGEPIGIPRLLARPTATLSLEAQQRRELKQKLYGD